MQAYKAQIWVLFKRISLVYLLFFISRLLFYFFNQRHFNLEGAGELFSVFFYGMRFDTFSILACNSLFIILSVIPFSFTYSLRYQKFLKRLFIISNSVFLSFNFIDMAYYHFIGKRSTFDIFNQMGGQTDVMKQIPYYLRDFWPVILLFILAVYFFSKIYPKLNVNEQKYDYTGKSISVYSLGFIVICLLSVLGLRGGLQRVPIDFADAGNYSRPQNVSLVLNSPFTLIKSYSRAGLEEYNFTFNENAFAAIKPFKKFEGKLFNNNNIVILMLESFSKEYTGIGNRKSATPFLDSLMKNSLVFTNAWANGTKSIEGIPAILASIPCLTNDPFINSPYCNNTINSLATLLKKKNYNSAFMHGGINGTMNFDVFAKQSDFDVYLGRNEYNNESDFDGNWGIWDEPYLQYCTKKLSEFKEPFFGAIFTLSSHHPYKVPEKYAGKFPKYELENSESIGYADFALKKFFETASKLPWFDRTLFVLVADHASISSDPFYANTLGQHAIPVLFYKKNSLIRGVNHHLMEQIDIMPTLLDTMGYELPFFSLGKSVFKDTTGNYAVFYDSGNHYLVNDSMFFAYNQFKPVQKIRFISDSTLSHNLKNYNSTASDSYFKNFVQVHNYSVIKNKMTAGSLK